MKKNYLEMDEVKMLTLISYYLILDGDGGIMSTSPSQLIETTYSMHSPYYMFSCLGEESKKKAFLWGEKWGVNFDSLTKEMEKDYHSLSMDEFRKKYWIDTSILVGINYGEEEK